MNTDENSGFEIIVFFVSFGATLAGWSKYYSSLMKVSALKRRLGQRWPLFVAPQAGLLVMLIVLLRYAAKDVRTNGSYLILFMLLGAAWIFWGAKLFSLLGLSLHEDALEQNNSSAVIATSGAILALSFTYAGGNIGEGDTIWTTIFSSGLATLGLFACWLILEIVARVSLAITEERDAATGLRLAGFLLTIGLILGRAVAGDWHSTESTLRDFGHFGWPALLLTAAAILVEYKLQPTLDRPIPPITIFGIYPASLYVSFGLLDLIALGKWN